MLVIALVMLVILVVAVLVVTFAAFPHRGEEVPAAPWLGEAMTKAADALPTLDNPDAAAPQPAPQPTSQPTPPPAPRKGAGTQAPGRKGTGSLF